MEERVIGSKEEREYEAPMRRTYAKGERKTVRGYKEEEHGGRERKEG